MYAQIIRDSFLISLLDWFKLTEGLPSIQEQSACGKSGRTVCSPFFRPRCFCERHRYLRQRSCTQDTDDKMNPCDSAYGPRGSRSRATRGLSQRYPTSSCTVWLLELIPFLFLLLNRQYIVEMQRPSSDMSAAQDGIHLLMLTKSQRVQSIALNLVLLNWGRWTTNVLL